MASNTPNPSPQDKSSWSGILNSFTNLFKRGPSEPTEVFTAKNRAKMSFADTPSAHVFLQHPEEIPEPNRLTIKSPVNHLEDPRWNDPFSKFKIANDDHQVSRALTCFKNVVYLMGQSFEYTKYLADVQDGKHPTPRDPLLAVINKPDANGNALRISVEEGGGYLRYDREEHALKISADSFADYFRLLERTVLSFTLVECKFDADSEDRIAARTFGQAGDDTAYRLKGIETYLRALEIPAEQEHDKAVWLCAINYAVKRQELVAASHKLASSVLTIKDSIADRFSSMDNLSDNSDELRLIQDLYGKSVRIAMKLSPNIKIEVTRARYTDGQLVQLSPGENIFRIGDEEASVDNDKLDELFESDAQAAYDGVLDTLSELRAHSNLWAGKLYGTPESFLEGLKKEANNFADAINGSYEAAMAYRKLFPNVESE